MRALLLFFALDNILGGALAKTLSGITFTFCSTQLDGQGYCWGKGVAGQLGQGEFKASPFPVKMLNVHNATDVAAGWSHTCIVDEGKARCTGESHLIGHSSITAKTHTLVDVEGVDYPVETVDQVFVGYSHSCLVTSTGGAKCWGINHFGQFGNSAAISNKQAFPVVDFATNGVATIAIGKEHTCLLNAMGKVYCTGRNLEGQLGRGYSDSSINAVMQPIVGNAAEEIMVSIACGQVHVCAVSDTGNLYCWGKGAFGQLGQGDTTSLSTPTLVPGLNDIATVHCGWENTFALLKNNQGIRAFGYNAYGNLGLGSDIEDKLSPVTVFADQSNIVEISGGYYAECIKLKSGAVRCFGPDYYGHLGNGLPYEKSLTFVHVLYLSDTPAPTTSPTFTSPTQQPSVSPVFQSTSAPSITTTVEEEAEQDLSLVGLVALAPILAVMGAVVYCKFIKPPTSQGGALQAPSNPV